MRTARTTVLRLLACLLLGGLSPPALVAGAAQAEACFAGTGFCPFRKYLG